MKIVETKILVTEINFTETDRKIIVKISDSLPAEENLQIKMGQIIKDLIVISSDNSKEQKGLRFLQENLPKERTEFYYIFTEEDLTGGEYQPEILSNKGQLEASKDIKIDKIIFKITVENMKPKILPFSGGQKTRISGKNFMKTTAFKKFQGFFLYHFCK